MQRTSVMTAVLLALAFAGSDVPTADPVTSPVSPISSPQSPFAITIPQLVSYQGKLTDTMGIPVPNGNYSIRFALYTQASGGSPYWQETQNVSTEEGLFAVLLGSVTPVPYVPEAGNLYLGMKVGSDPEMTPRVRIVSAAYAYLSRKADTADYVASARPSGSAGGDLTGSYPDPTIDVDAVTTPKIYDLAVTDAKLASGAVTAQKLSQMGAATGQILKWTGSVWAPRNDSVGGGGGGGTVTSVSQGTGVTCTPNPITTTGTVALNTGYSDGRYVNVTGDSMSGMLRIGNQLQVHNKVALGYSCYNNGNAAFCAGYGNNAGGSMSSVSGGEDNSAGGKYAHISGGSENRASANWSTISGGNVNEASDTAATISGGRENYATAPHSTVGGGTGNDATGDCATVGGGRSNEASGPWSTVGGGIGNRATYNQATVGGGNNNEASGHESTIAGGFHNVAYGPTTTVAGGWYNVALRDQATVGGGRNNRADSAYSTVSGGIVNDATGTCATIGGGSSNVASGDTATIGGGVANEASGRNATVAGGSHNLADTLNATVGGGRYNQAYGRRSTIAGGNFNRVDSIGGFIGGGYNNTARTHATIAGGIFGVAFGTYSTIGGGYSNRADSFCATIAGGYDNFATANCASVGGGNINRAIDSCATVGGGFRCVAGGKFSTVPGGYIDTASADYSFATNNHSVVPSTRTNSAAFNGQRATASNQLRCGTLSKAGGSFTIDHPADPYGKVLNHYFTEGPEMLNIYRGSVVLDASGRAEAKLPGYFSSLNRNPMVQLTGVGAPDVYVAEDVSGNRFTIGGPAGTKVYWQVTGERKDVSAEAIRRMMPVEQSKTGDLAGVMLDDDFLLGCMEQLEREGKAHEIGFRTAAGRQRFENPDMWIEKPTEEHND